MASCPIMLELPRPSLRFSTSLTVGNLLKRHEGCLKRFLSAASLVRLHLLSVSHSSPPFFDSSLQELLKSRTRHLNKYVVYMLFSNQRADFISMCDSSPANKQSSSLPKSSQGGSISNQEKRSQPWKSFIDPNSQQCAEIIAAPPDQKVYHVGNAAFAQYAHENGG